MCRPRFDESTMNALRAQGLANKQIAARMGCSYQTVFRRIGKQSDELSKARKTEAVRHAFRVKTLTQMEAERQATQKRIISLTERRKQLYASMVKLDKQLELENLKLQRLRA